MDRGGFITLLGAHFLERRKQLIKESHREGRFVCVWFSFTELRSIKPDFYSFLLLLSPSKPIQNYCPHPTLLNPATKWLTRSLGGAISALSSSKRLDCLVRLLFQSYPAFFLLLLLISPVGLPPSSLAENSPCETG